MRTLGSRDKMSAARDLSDVSYRPPPEGKKGISIRLPISLLAQLDELVDIWKAQATARKAAGGTDEPDNVDRSHVMVTLRETAVKGEFDLYGGRPVGEAGWKSLHEAIKVGVEKSNKVKK